MTLKFMNNYKKIFLYTCLIGLVGLGVYFRLVKWQANASKAGDEGLQLLTAEHFWNYQTLPESGEISALDASNQVIVHNSPLGFYWQIIVYALGQQQLDEYFLIYIFMNLISCLLLAKASSNFFSKKSGIMTLIFALFSNFMLHAAVWPSQPSNAIFFESIAIYLMSVFWTKKKNDYLLLATIISLLATQMYPPMYFLMPIKIVIFYKLTKRYSFNKSQCLTLLISSILIYLPLIWIEINHRFTNVDTVFNFLFQHRSQSNINLDLISTLKHFANNLFQQFQAGFNTINYELTNKQPLLVLLFLVLTGVIFFWHGRKQRVIFSSLAVSILCPILIMATILTISQQTTGERAYLTILVPYTLILVGALFSIFNNKSWLLIVVSIILILIRTAINQELNTTHPTFIEIEQSADYIADQISKDITNNQLHVISGGDKWDWDSTIYWYFIEKKLKKQLVIIDFNSSKTKRLSEYEPQTVHLLCHSTNQTFTGKKVSRRFF